ncbi:MAG: methyl-accepting chemotaxis protein [Planctomycetes bacterium]|nr:methyl-accepting chemotaxis protein [Planctomycetota bacterium]
MSLKVRLLLGFLLCAVLAVCAVGVGVYSLHEVNSNFSKTASQVQGTLESQGSLGHRVSLLRSSMDGIREAEKEEALNEELEEAKSASQNSPESDIELWQSIVGELAPMQAERISAISSQEQALENARVAREGIASVSKNAEKVRQQIMAEVKSLATEVTAIADTVDFNSILAMEDSFEGILESAKVEGYKIAEVMKGHTGGGNITEIELRQTLEGLISSFDAKQKASSKALSQSIEKAQDIISTASDSSKSTSTLMSHSKELRTLALECLLATDPSMVDYSKNPMSTLLEDIKGGVSSLEEDENTLNVLKILKAMPPLFEDMRTTRKQAISKEENRDQAQKALVEARQLTNDVENKMSLVVSSIREQLEDSENDLALMVKDTQQTTSTNLSSVSDFVSQWIDRLYGIGIVAFLVALVLGVISASAVSKPLHQCVGMLKDISQGDGDLTKRLDIKAKHEIGILANHFNTFTDTIHNIVKNVFDCCTELASASDGLSKSAKEMTSDAQGMSERTGSVASVITEMNMNFTTISSASEEMSVNLNNVSSATTEIADSMKNVTKAVEELSQSSENISKDCVSGSSQAGDAQKNAKVSSDIMSRLSEASGNIGAVVDTIKDIADKTNLLALNATIEAASAGDAGKGFAVVAGEIKELSRQTASATEEIAKLIENVKESSEEAVGASQEISKTIDGLHSTVETISSSVHQMSTTTEGVTTNVEMASQKINDVANNIQEASSGVNEIAANIQEGSKAIGEIDENIQGVNTLAQKNAQGSSATAEAAGKISDTTMNLKGLVGRFKL